MMYTVSSQDFCFAIFEVAISPKLPAIKKCNPLKSVKFSPSRINDYVIHVNIYLTGKETHISRFFV